MRKVDVRVPELDQLDGGVVVERIAGAGQSIRRGDPLVIVESEKSAVEVPAPYSGKVIEWLVNVGDTVTQGAKLLVLEVEDTELSQETSVETNSPFAGDISDSACDLVVVGSGPGGYTAAFRAADLGLNVILVERYPSLGGVCLNVGCIPSKALLHAASAVEGVGHLSDMGIEAKLGAVNVQRLREFKAKAVNRLTGGIKGLARSRRVRVMQGVASFTGDAHCIEVHKTDDHGALIEGAVQVVRFKHAIIATGSSPVRLPFLPADPRVVDSTDALELPTIPRRMLILGGGIIGLELGTVYSALGARLDLAELTDGVMQGAERSHVEVWMRANAHRFDRFMLETRVVAAEATAEGICVEFQAADGRTNRETYDLVLQAAGRAPNGKKVGVEKVGVTVSDRGFIPVDEQMRTNIPHIFAIGDVAGMPMLAHKAVHEANVAAEVIAGTVLGAPELANARLRNPLIPSVAYTNPEIAWVGFSPAQAKAKGIVVDEATFPWAASGKAVSNEASEGLTTLYFDATTGNIVGGAVVGAHAGELIAEVTLAIKMHADAHEIMTTIHAHPTLSETIAFASEVAAGTCTDLPPVQKQG